LPSAAQFIELATTDDGRQLYLSTTLVMRGAAPAAPEYRIFRFIPEGVFPFAERGELAPREYSSSGEGARNPQVSGDGQTVAWTFQNVCPTAEPCLQAETRAVVRGRGEQPLANGRVHLSRNAEWALMAPTSNPDAPQESTLIHLPSGRRATVPAVPDFAKHIVASDGSVLIRGERGVSRSGAMAGPFLCRSPAISCPGRSATMRERWC
jgi:hypothetical protein